MAFSLSVAYLIVTLQPWISIVSIGEFIIVEPPQKYVSRPQMRSALFLGNSQICPRRPCEAGSHQAAICYRNTGIAPLRRSDRAAQCSDAFKAGVSLFLLTVIAVPVAIRHLQQVLPLASRSGRSSRTRLSWLTLSRIVRSNVLDEMLVQFSRYTEGEKKPPHYTQILRPFFRVY